MIQFLIILLVFISSTFAADTDWTVMTPSENRMFLSHPTKNIFVLITRFKTGFSDEKFDEYLVSDFPDDLKKSRREFLNSQQDSWQKLMTGTDTLNGHRYGSSAFVARPGKVETTFGERIWVNKSTLWHVAIINGGSDQLEIMNEIMTTINDPKKTSFFGSPISKAYAGEDDSCSEIHDTEFRELKGIVSKINDRNCNLKGIHPSKLSKYYGLKFSSAEFSSCLKGSGDALRSMKNGFLSTIDSWQEKTGEQMKKLNCVEPKQPSGFIAAIGYSQQVQTYQYCLSAASTAAGIGMVADSLMETGIALKSLYQWVKAEENPLGIITSILASKYEGFMCLTPEAQQEAICEFSTHFLTALAATAAGAGSVMAIKKGLGAVRGIAALAPVMTKSPAIARALLDARKKVAGISPAFLHADDFVVSVGKGQAEAAKVIEALRKGAILEKNPAQMDAALKAKGFTRIDTCIKMNGKCVEHINAKTGQKEIAPMVVYVHPSGVAARIKPHGDSTSKFRPNPHGSFMLVDPENKKLAEGIKAMKGKSGDPEAFMNKYLSWEKELAKVDMKTGNPLPSAPSRTRMPEGMSDADKNLYNDTLSGLTHFSVD
jgi:hypothetical protein